MRVLYFGLTLWLLLLFVTPTLGAETRTRRFQAHQLSFSLQDSDGLTVKCSHELLKHVPWWRVTCESRSYTVDVWREHLTNKGQNLSRLTLMYHVSEGVASSGEKMVQFNTHFTSFELTDTPSLQFMSSSMDVRNGQASLVVRAQL